MRMKRTTRALAAAAAAAALTACGSMAESYVPPEAIAPPAAQISDALIAFGKKVQEEQLKEYRRKAREDAFRTSIRDFLVAGKFSEANFEATFQPEQAILCRPNYGLQRLAGPVQNTTAKATAVKALLAPPSDEWRPLLLSLSTKYSVDVTATEVPKDYDAWKATDAGTRCVEAVKAADPFVTRGNLETENAIVAAEALKALFDAVWGVVKPAVVGALQNANIEKRNKVVVDYFAVDENVAAMKRDLGRIEDYISGEFKLEQQRTAGKAVYAIKQFRDFESAHWKKAIGIAGAQTCTQAFVKWPTDKTNTRAVGCLNDAFDALTGPLNVALDAGDTFDQQLEKSLPREKLSSQIDQVAQIAKGNMPDEAKLKTLWATLVRYASLYNTIKDTGSSDNQAKLKDAWQKFLDAAK